METFPEDEENRATTTAIERSKRSNRSTEKRLSGTSLLNEHGGDSEVVYWGRRDSMPNKLP